jgi:hypothetical protein
MKDEMKTIAAALQKIAGAIRDPEADMGTDASGGRINSLLESVMGITAGLYKVAEANYEAGSSIENGLIEVSDAIRAFAAVYRDKE